MEQAFSLYSELGGRPVRASGNRPDLPGPAAPGPDDWAMCAENAMVIDLTVYDRPQPDEARTQPE